MEIFIIMDYDEVVFAGGWDSFVEYCKDLDCVWADIWKDGKDIGLARKKSGDDNIYKSYD